MEEEKTPCDIGDCNVLPDGITNPKRCIHFDNGECTK